MKNIIILTLTNIKRNKTAIILSIAGAMLLCLMLSMIGKMIMNRDLNDIDIGVIDYDQSLLSKDFKNYLVEELHYHLIDNHSFEELSAELIDKEISVIIEIPAGFYKEFAEGNDKNIILTSSDDFENVEFVKLYINSYLSSIGTISRGAAGDRSVFDQLLLEYTKSEIKLTQTAAVVIDKKVYADQAGFYNSIGFFLMFIIAVSIVVSFMILEDRMLGIYQRIQAAPVKPVQYIIGSGIFGLVLSLIQIGLYCGYIQLRNIDTGVPMPLLILFMSLFSLFAMGFSLAIAQLILSKSAMISMLFGFATIGCILGGAFFPIDMAPKMMQNLAKLFPQYWFMDAVCLLQDNAKSNIYPHITILVLFSILTILSGAVAFAQNYRSDR